MIKFQIISYGYMMNTYEALRKTMVDTQVRPSGVSRVDVIEAIGEIPRELFLPDHLKKLSYVEGNLNLGSNNFIIEPRILAKLLQSLAINRQESVLVLGSGCGYVAAVIGKLSELVVGVENNKDNVDSSDQAIISAGINNIIIMHGELGLGAPKHGPYDVVVFPGGVHEIPEVILDQVKEGGRVAAFFTEDSLTQAKIGVKVKGSISWRTYFDCDVPLIKEFEMTQVFSL